VLDEPFNGLDPDGIVWMRGFLTSLARQGRAVPVSSHLMSELQDTADQLLVIGRGRAVADAGVTELLAEASGGRVTLRTSEPQRANGCCAARAPPFSPPTRNPGCHGPARRGDRRLLARNGVPFSQVSAHRATLEEVYRELTRDTVEYQGIPAGGAAS
jgi:ABC-2 type transport system ATP-binding protein